MLKVGDKVKVKRGLEVNKHYGGVRFSDNMENIKEGTIGSVEDLGFKDSLIVYTMLENGYFWSEDMLERIEDYKMKGLTFKEVIANIKEGEVWESEVSYIGKRKGVIDIWDNEPDNTVKSIFDDTLFKLKRKQYTFQEAFKSFEEGKEIESEYGIKYKFDKTSFEVHIIETQYENRTTVYCFEDVLFRCDEIKGKWYINN